MEMLIGESSCLLGSWTLKRLAKMLNNAILLTEIFFVLEDRVILNKNINRYGFIIILK